MKVINRKEIMYRSEKMNEVRHATLNPNGPGAIRIHLIPPAMGVENAKDIDIEKYPAMIILNGQYYVPVNRSFSVLLNEFLTLLDKYAGKTVKDVDIEKIVKTTIKNVRKIYPFTSSKRMKEDLGNVIELFCDIAYGKTIETDEIPVMSIGSYAPFMRAPYRMDLMILAMTKDGNWHCNQKCLHCYAAGQPDAEVEELSTKQWGEIIKKCYKACISQVTFTGGEPTMRKDLPEIVGYAKKLVTRLNTNGINMTKKLYKQLFDASLDCVQVTFYSSDPRKHNYLVGAEMYEKTLQGIKNILEVGLNISINTPLCSINKDYVKTLEFLHNLGIQYVTCSGLIITGNATKEKSISSQLSKEEIYSILEEAVAYCEKNDMELAFTSPGWIPEEDLKRLKLTVPSCGACLSNMAVAPDGSVVLCQSWLSEEPLGNILCDEWDTIWNSEKCKKIRKESAKMEYKCPLNNAHKNI